jgi:hypothetical protein
MPFVPKYNHAIVIIIDELHNLLIIHSKKQTNKHIFSKNKISGLFLSTLTVVANFSYEPE